MHTKHMNSLNRQILRFTSACTLYAAYPKLLFADSLQTGIKAAEGIKVGGTSDIKTTTQLILNNVLTYLAIIAVAVLVIAGFTLVLGFGSDESRKKAKNIVIYTIVGLIVIALAKAFVIFVIEAGQ